MNGEASQADGINGDASLSGSTHDAAPVPAPVPAPAENANTSHSTHTSSESHAAPLAAVAAIAATAAAATAVAHAVSAPAHTAEAAPAVPAAAATPAATAAPAPAQAAEPIVIRKPVEQLLAERQSMLDGAGLALVETDSQKWRAAYDRASSYIEPARTPRVRRPAPALDQGPLQQIETRK